METQSDNNNANASNNNNSVQPSFDEVVELISTGRADQIPGIKDIPLKINEATPSAPTMSRPAKPWERAATQQETLNDDVAPQFNQSDAPTRQNVSQT